MEQIKAVLFDLDNTLHDRTGSFQQFARSFLDQYFNHLDSTEHLLEKIIELDQDGYKDRNVLFSELLDEMPWSTKPTKDELLSYYKPRYVNYASFMDHAQEVIAYVKMKYTTTGIITNGSNATQYAKIDHLGIRDDFDLILVSEEAGVKKPDPRIFEMALDKLGLQPEECIYIGDHPINDIEGASKAGMHTIWIQANQPWREGLEAKPLYTIHRLSELLELL